MQNRINLPSRKMNVAFHWLNSVSDTCFPVSCFPIVTMKNRFFHACIAKRIRFCFLKGILFEKKRKQCKNPLPHTFHEFKYGLYYRYYYFLQWMAPVAGIEHNMKPIIDATVSNNFPNTNHMSLSILILMSCILVYRTWE